VFFTLTKIDKKSVQNSDKKRTQCIQNLLSNTRILIIMSVPKSKNANAILVLLNAMPLSTSDIAANLSLKTNLVRRYLNYLKMKGLVDKKDDLWYLTEQGEKVVKHILEMRNNKKLQEHIAIAKEVMAGKDSVRIENLDSDEKEILLFLLNKYKQWGSTYMYLDQMQEEFGADFNWLIKVLRNLQTKRIVYLYHDPKLGFRIGFTQEAKRTLL